MKKSFSYVGIIFAIVLLGILLWIVYPRTEVVQEEIVKEAKEIKSMVDTSSIQNAINLYAIQNEELPTYDNVSIGVPQKIDFSKLVTDYIKTAPSNTENYWIDSNAKVSYCSLNPNNYAELQRSNSLIAWSLVEGVQSYQIYDLNAKNGEYAFLGGAEGDYNYFKLNSIDANSIYGISLVDFSGNECPAVKVTQ